MPAPVRIVGSYLSPYVRKVLVCLHVKGIAWVWTQRDSIPLRDGFLNLWHASVPVGERVLEIDGVCTVQLRGGLIASNQVFFDRSELLAAIRAARPSTTS